MTPPPAHCDDAMCVRTSALLRVRTSAPQHPAPQYLCVFAPQYLCVFAPQYLSTSVPQYICVFAPQHLSTPHLSTSACPHLSTSATPHDMNYRVLRKSFLCSSSSRKS